MHKIKHYLSTVSGAVTTACFFGWGVFIWKLSRPGLSVLETAAVLSVSYGVIGVYLLMLNKACRVALPVRIVNRPGQCLPEDPEELRFLQHEIYAHTSLVGAQLQLYCTNDE